ncbi:hypothetical protein WN990_08450 [Kitasatospora purpeofusca]|uniref:hypothetical protein n=1 Tax=Kitasatospora purpeofusca TaxID=67352 RepID=UPI0030F34255
MKTTHRRRLGAAVTVALTAGLFAAPAAAAGTDVTPPRVAVSSADFPSGPGSTSVKYAGQIGTFVLTGTDLAPEGDTASGVACFSYVINGTLGVSDRHCGPGTVAAGPDGTVSVALRVPQWGTNILTVQAEDNAGNVSQPFSYTFYARSNPNPPQAPGDVDGDGVPDILLPDAAGNLQIIGASAADTTPTSVVAASAAPNRTSWSTVQLAHRGWRGHAPIDDVLTHEPGSVALNFYYNADYGTFRQAPSNVARPTSCQSAAGTATACPADYARDWSRADQLVALGSLNTQPLASLLTVENGDLWLFPNPGLQYRLSTARKLTTGGAWAGLDLIAPGPDAAGNLALWARERATGALHAYPVPKLANGTFDFSALADPVAGVVATGFTTEAYPVLGSSGDGDGDKVPDLWAVTADRHLLTYRGLADPKDLGLLR